MVCACVATCVAYIRYARTPYSALHSLLVSGCEEGIYRMVRVYRDEIGSRDAALEVFVIDHT